MPRKSRSAAFFMEIIIAIGFFSAACAICSGLFAQARVKSVYARELSMAVISAQSAAEAFKAAEGSPHRITEILKCEDNGSGVFRVFYNGDWSRADFSGRYRLEIKINSGTVPASADISIFGGGETPIYELNVKKYVPPEGAA